MRRPQDDREDPERRSRLRDAAPLTDAAPAEAEALSPQDEAVSRLQRTAGNAAVTRAVGPGAEGPARRVAERLVPGLGRPLDHGVRDEVARRMGADVGEVRVHTGAQADRAARSLGARAYTAGRNVVFRDGEFDPASRDGAELLAHELAHVAQQGDGGGSAALAGPGARAAEGDARAAGRSAAAGERAAAPQRPSAAVVQGDAEERVEEDWRDLGDVFEADDETPGPVVLAEGLATTAQRVRETLQRTEPLVTDDRERRRLRTAGDELDRGEDELPDLVAEFDPERLPQATDAFEEMVEGLDELEKVTQPADDRRRFSRELGRVTRAAGDLAKALPSGRWAARIQKVADLAPLARAIGAGPVAGGGGDDDDGEAPPAGKDDA